MKLKTLKDIELSAEELARIFHDTYENFSITNKWKTQSKCQVAFDDLPQKNKQTMIDTCQHILLILEVREKQEAIKWVKWKLENSDLEIEKISWKDDRATINFKGTDKFAAGFIQGIVELNNITEEDLKKGGEKENETM